VIVNFFLQILDLALDLFEKTAAYAANRLIFSFVQPVLGSGFLFLEGLPGSRKLLKAALRR
jgi:hypothetical protein